MNARGIGIWVVGFCILPFSCRDFGDSPGATAAGETDVGGASPGGEAGSVNSSGTGDSGAHAGSGQSGADSAVGGRAHDGKLAGASGSSAGNDARDAAGSAAGGSQGEGGAHSVKSLSPAEVEKVVLWLSASPESCVRGEDQRISVWVDRSGHGNNAGPGGGLPPPRFVSGEANGHDLVRFTPTESSNAPHLPERLQIPDDDSLHLAGGDFSIFLVGKFSNPASPVDMVTAETDLVFYNGAGTLLAKQEHFIPYRGILWSANYPSSYPTVKAHTRLAVQLALAGPIAMGYSDNMNDGGLRLYGLRRRGTDLGLFVNGETEGGTHVPASTNLSAVGFPMVLGGEPVQPLRGDIAEIVLVKGATSDTENEGLQKYLMETYGLL